MLAGWLTEKLSLNVLLIEAIRTIAFVGICVIIPGGNLKTVSLNTSRRLPVSKVNKLLIKKLQSLRPLKHLPLRQSQCSTAAAASWMMMMTTAILASMKHLAPPCDANVPILKYDPYSV